MPCTIQNMIKMENVQKEGGRGEFLRKRKNRKIMNLNLGLKYIYIANLISFPVNFKLFIFSRGNKCD
jgi:hypothetical protein